VTSLDRQDLRGWHYVLTGGVLGSLSPYGFDVGMTGRWAYVSDSVEAVTAAGPGERDGSWLGGIREYIPDAGPVSSRRFP
jgi:hypothetical protein